MGAINAPLYAFNRGLIGKHALGRVDVEKLRLSAELQTNWLPFVLGPMMLRPGTEYIGAISNGDEARIIPFIFSKTDTALLEIVNSKLRVRIDGTLISRASVSTSIANGDFSASTGWTVSGSTADINSTVSGALVLANATLGSDAHAVRSVTVASGDQATEHAVKIVVTRGPVVFRCGTTSGADDLISETTLDTGEHHLAFTPGAGTFYVYFLTTTAQLKIVDSIQIASSGTMEIATPWSGDDKFGIRYDQSGDIVYVACDGLQQRKIERRGAKSWSVVKYYSDDGPFGNPNTTDIAMTPGALTGNTTLTASRAYFKSTHVGALFRVFSAGQTVTSDIAAENTFTSAIRVSGVDAARIFSRQVSGTWAGTWTMQRSFDSATSGFQDVDGTSGNFGPSNYNDNLNNSIAWYRIGFKTGNYTSGTATFGLIYSGGGAAGICRVTSFSSSTVVNVEVLTVFSSLTATNTWNEGDWSDRQGWPSAVRFHEGRLWWLGRDRLWGSVSDNYVSYSYEATGDSATINRSFGSGPVEIINWALSLSRLLVGREMSEASVRSSSFDEPLTPTNFSIKDCSTQGSARLPAIKIDTRGIFVQQSGRKVYELAYSVDTQDYRSRDLTRLNLDIGVPGFVALAAARQPDTQIYLVLDDGTVACLLYDVDDDVLCWWLLESDGASGEIEDVAVLPGDLEDEVYFVVKRTISGSTVRYIEKLARRDECVGGTTNKNADCHLVYSGSAVTTITGLSHLEGEEVVIWGNGKDLGTKTVASGQITGLSESVTAAVVGLAYEADFKSAKLAYAAQKGTAINQKKKIDQLGLLLADTHYQGIRYGTDADHLRDLPQIERGKATPSDYVWSEYDQPTFPFNGTFDTDTRIYLRAAAPRPACVMGAVIGIETHDK